MRYCKFVFVVHIEFTIDMLIKKLAYHYDIIKLRNARNDTIMYKHCQYKTF